MPVRGERRTSRPAGSMPKVNNLAGKRVKMPRFGKKRPRSAEHGEGDHPQENGAQPHKKFRVRTVFHPAYGLAPGYVLALGEGDTGQLGLGPDTMERTKPGKVDLPPNTVQVCAGGMHTACVTKDGEIFTFGCNDEGALGRKTADEDDMFEPGLVELPDKCLFVCAGDSHTAALTERGHVYSWGTFRDANGSIGLNTEGKTEIPNRILPGVTVLKIASGSDHLVCLTVDGEIYTLGAAEQGQLGRVAECFSGRGGRKGLGKLLEPGLVHFKKRKTRFSDIWAGQYVTFAKSKSGEVYAWGLNNYYQLGISDMKNRFMPELCKAFDPDKDWKEISSGQHHSIALDSNGQVYCFGRKEYGRLGMGEDVEEIKEPTLIPALKDIKCIQVSCGSAVSFAVSESGDIYAWGMGTSKQLGQTEEDDLWLPTKMTGKQLETRHGLMAVAGGQHTVILARDKEATKGKIASKQSSKQKSKQKNNTDKTEDSEMNEDSDSQISKKEEKEADKTEDSAMDNDSNAKELEEEEKEVDKTEDSEMNDDSNVQGSGEEGEEATNTSMNQSKDENVDST